MRRGSAGFAVVNAIFLIIVLGALGAAAVTLSKTEADAGTKSLLAAKVYYGARAGLDWGIQQTLSDPNIAPSASNRCNSATFPSPFTFTLSDANLAGIVVTVTCSFSTHGTGALVYYITSRATTGAPGSFNYAERRMEATVANIP